MGVAGRGTPGLSAAISGAFQVVIWSVKIPSAVLGRQVQARDLRTVAAGEVECQRDGLGRRDVRCPLGKGGVGHRRTRRADAIEVAQSIITLISSVSVPAGRVPAQVIRSPGDRGSWHLRRLGFGLREDSPGGDSGLAGRLDAGQLVQRRRADLDAPSDLRFHLLHGADDP
jgi:hypothetical protein